MSPIKGCMIFDIHIPSYPLSQFVESFVYYKDYKPTHAVDRFLPDGNINLIVDLTDYPKFIYDNDTLKEIQSCRNVWFSGIRNRYITIPSGRDSEMFIVNFHKGMAYPFVEMPLYELTDYVVDGELVMSGEILNIREQLLVARTPKEKFICVERCLTTLYRKKLHVNPFVGYAVHEILKAPQAVTIGDISRKVGYSQKHLINMFKSHVGLTPKAFLKVIRFQKAIGEIELRKTPDWVTVAHESGYYDQAHFNNDFRQFSGFTPQQYLVQRSEYLNYIAVG